MDTVMRLYVERSLKVYTFVGNSFGADSRLDMFSKKVQSHEAVFFVCWR